MDTCSSLNLRKIRQNHINYTRIKLRYTLLFIMKNVYRSIIYGNALQLTKNLETYSYNSGIYRLCYLIFNFGWIRLLTLSNNKEQAAWRMKGYGVIPKLTCLKCMLILMASIITYWFGNMTDTNLYLSLRN
jgi:hypothetical protein